MVGSNAAIEPLPRRDPWLGLAEESRWIGVPVDREAAARFARFRDLLLDRNAHLNLTAVRDPIEVERRLFLDALAMLPAIDREVSPVDLARARLIDIGSGAGFPGLALKIARPHLDVTLVDATAKKVAFIEEVIADLGLAGARAIHGRAEDLGQDPAYRETFALATARAVAALPVLLEYVTPFLAVGGTAYLPKGLTIDEELRRGHRAAKALGAEIVSTEQLPVANTRLVVARKYAPAPAAYPRRTGLPSRDPLGEGS
jgi:16S rRNA (guanine527-N7)-methyltransferase